VGRDAPPLTLLEGGSARRGAGEARIYSLGAFFGRDGGLDPELGGAEVERVRVPGYGMKIYRETAVVPMPLVETALPARVGAGAGAAAMRA
jgi:hypothetical protein